MDKSCPLCRKPLPPGIEKLFDLGYGMFMKIKGDIDRGRPRADRLNPWPALSTEQQQEMDQARAMLREAADQGHMMAQAHVGDMYTFGWGVAKDDRLAFLYHEKAAQQGWVVSQHNIGVNYRDGLGCEQSYERAVEWYEKAARQGYSGAESELGRCYDKGEGVPRCYERAVEWYKKSAAKGHMIGQNNLGSCYEDGAGVPQNYQEARRLYKLASAKGYDLATESLMRVEELIRKDPTQALTRPAANKKPKPNAPCSCGSGNKYKKCCGSNK